MVFYQKNHCWFDTEKDKDLIADVQSLLEDHIDATLSLHDAVRLHENAWFLPEINLIVSLSITPTNFAQGRIIKSV